MGAEPQLKAFEDVAREAGLTDTQVDARLGMDGPRGEQNRVVQVATDMLSNPDRPTALDGGNNEIALQANLGTDGHGLSMPTDICIVGYDNSRSVSLALKSDFATVTSPHCDLGYRGADRLQRLFDHRDNEVRSVDP